MSFSSLASILGERSTIHFLPALFILSFLIEVEISSLTLIDYMEIHAMQITCEVQIQLKLTE